MMLRTIRNRKLRVEHLEMRSVLASDMAAAMGTSTMDNAAADPATTVQEANASTCWANENMDTGGNVDSTSDTSASPSGEDGSDTSASADTSTDASADADGLHISIDVSLGGS